MTVKELREAIAEMPEDMLVYVYADHGQTTQAADCVAVFPVAKESFEENSYEPETVHPDDVEEDGEYIKICEIG